MRTFDTEVSVEIDEDEIIEWLEDNGYTVIADDAANAKEDLRGKSKWKNLGDSCNDAAIAVELVKANSKDGLREFLTHYLNIPYLTDKDTIIKAISDALV